MQSCGAQVSSDIDAALMAFSEWKDQGRLGMPAIYVSETHKRTMTCFVAKKVRADALELLKAPVVPGMGQVKIVHPEANPAAVHPLAESGWYVPDPPPEVQEEDSAAQEWEEYVHPETGASWWWNSRTEEALLSPPPGWTQRA
ncbi:unnamed protein product [Cladocopium goreaui]|uniref:Uncharacterized protein n=1 Tax=Cladocopium goreaui TaxID=2562237 RepID=A0A9P1C928_9DINO|nr:unnamed protein product [Cladocopium goreaui]